MACLGLDTPAKLFVFIFYIGLFVTYACLNENAKRQHITFNSSHAVWIQTLFKIVLAAGCYLHTDGSVRDMMQGIRSNKRYFYLYVIPAGLYGLYDILAYVNLRNFDAPTYFLLMNFKLVVTAILHNRFFSKTLSRNQWVALVVITAGCALKTHGDHAESAAAGGGVGPSLWAYILLSVQILSSAAAAVYNEGLLKGDSSVSVNLQNVFMYADTFLLILLSHITGLSAYSNAGQQNGSSGGLFASLSVLCSIHIFPMILIMSCIGIATSLFLKLLDSIKKSIASSLELVVLPLFTFLLFDTPVRPTLIGSIALVAGGVLLYSTPHSTPNSVSSKPSQV